MHCYELSDLALHQQNADMFDGKNVTTLLLLDVHIHQNYQWDYKPCSYHPQLSVRFWHRLQTAMLGGQAGHCMHEIDISQLAVQPAKKAGKLQMHSQHCACSKSLVTINNTSLV